MGWTFRKSFTLGPFRINISRSGISYSVGLGGFRWGVDSKGKTYKSVSVPGTGLNYRASGSTKKTAAGKSETSKSTTSKSKATKTKDEDE